MRFMIYDFKKKESLYCGRNDHNNNDPCNCTCMKCDSLVIKKDES